MSDFLVRILPPPTYVMTMRQGGSRDGSGKVLFGEAP
jgi:hypothetical protein